MASDAPMSSVLLACHCALGQPARVVASQSVPRCPSVRALVARGLRVALCTAAPRACADLGSSDLALATAVRMALQTHEPLLCVSAVCCLDCARAMLMCKCVALHIGVLPSCAGTFRPVGQCAL